MASSLLADLPPFVETRPHELDVLIVAGHNQGAVSVGRCIYRLTYGESPEKHLAAMQAGLDWMMRPD